MGFIKKAISLFGIFLILASSVKSVDVSYSTHSSPADAHSYFTSGNTAEFVLPAIAKLSLSGAFNLSMFGSDHCWQFSDYPLVFEIIQANELVSYLKYAQKIIPGLPLRDIIFPFHIYI